MMVRVPGRAYWFCLLTLLLLLANLAGRSPGPTPSPPKPGPRQRSLKGGGYSSAEALNNSSVSTTKKQSLKVEVEPWAESDQLSAEEKQTIKKILEEKDVLRVEPLVRKPGNRAKSAKLDKALFNFADFQPGRASRVVDYGVNEALLALNREYQSKPAAAATGKGRPPQAKRFRPEDANSFDNDEAGLKVGTRLKPNQTKHILIATTWRSGSTFLGDLLNHYPGTFYYFEPLHYYSKRESPAPQQDRISFLLSLYRCKFDSDNLGYLHHVAKPANKFLFKNHNYRLMSSCSNLLPRETMCFMPDYLNAVCPLYPIKLIKTVRLRVELARHMLQADDLNFKLVVLVRDPRGVYSSRSKGDPAAWCTSPECASPKVGCNDLLLDVQSARSLAKEFPGRVLLLRYEDLSTNTEAMAKSLIRFLDLPWVQPISNYIKTHTNKDKVATVYNKKTKKVEKKVNAYSTTRNSSETAFKWRQTLSWGKIKSIQKDCSSAMSELGYIQLKSAAETQGPDLPVQSNPQQIWPAWTWNLET